MELWKKDSRLSQFESEWNTRVPQSGGSSPGLVTQPHFLPRGERIFDHPLAESTEASDTQWHSKTHQPPKFYPTTDLNRTGLVQ